MQAQREKKPDKFAKNQIKKQKAVIKILYANARGIQSKMNSLTAATLLYQPELIIITESHIVGKTNITIKDTEKKY